MARRLKFAEIGIAFIAVLGFGIHSVLLLFVALFLFGVIASLFGPIKYGILPDHLARSELPAGNALVEGATFIAILLGTIVGGVAAKDGGDPFHFAFLMIVFSLCAGARACSSRAPARPRPTWWCRRTSSLRPSAC